MFKEVSVVMSPRLHQVMVYLFEGLNDIQAHFQAEHNATGLNKPLWFLHRETTALEQAALSWLDPDSYVRLLGTSLSKPFKPRLQVRRARDYHQLPPCSSQCPLPHTSSRPPPRPAPRTAML